MGHRRQEADTALDEVVREAEEAETKVAEEREPARDQRGTADATTPNVEAQRSPHRRSREE